MGPDRLDLRRGVRGDLRPRPDLAVRRARGGAVLLRRRSPDRPARRLVGRHRALGRVILRVIGAVLRRHGRPAGLARPGLLAGPGRTRTPRPGPSPPWSSRWRRPPSPTCSPRGRRPSPASTPPTAGRSTCSSVVALAGDRRRLLDRPAPDRAGGGGRRGGAVPGRLGADRGPRVHGRGGHRPQQHDPDGPGLRRRLPGHHPDARPRTRPCSRLPIRSPPGGSLVAARPGADPPTPSGRSPPWAPSGSPWWAPPPWPWRRPIPTPTRSSPRPSTARPRRENPRHRAFGSSTSTASPSPWPSLQGKTVAITFLDDVCTTDCPVIAQEFRKPSGSSARHARHVELVAINANPRFLTPNYLQAFDQQESLTSLPNWRYLTGSSSPSCSRCGGPTAWRSQYLPGGAMIDHSEFAYVIDATGHTPLHPQHRPRAGNRGDQSSFSVDAGRHHQKACSATHERPTHRSPSPGRRPGCCAGRHGARLRAPATRSDQHGAHALRRGSDSAGHVHRDLPRGRGPPWPWGTSSDPNNTFWQLFYRPAGVPAWSNQVQATATATNGGLVLANGTGRQLVVGIRPSQNLHFTPLIATADAGRSWTNGLLDAGLAASPTALAVSLAGGTLAIVADNVGQSEVIANSGGLSAWRTLVTASDLASSPPAGRARPAGSARSPTSVPASWSGPAAASRAPAPFSSRKERDGKR